MTENKASDSTAAGLDARDTSPPKAEIHQGAASTSPYPVSRLAPAMDLVDTAKEIARANDVLGVTTNARLEQIARQMRALQDEARQVLRKTRIDQQLHAASCAFRKQPGKTYFLYQGRDELAVFSMLSLDDWRGKPPSRYLGAFCLEADMGWTAVDAEAKVYQESLDLTADGEPLSSKPFTT